MVLFMHALKANQFRVIENRLNSEMALINTLYLKYIVTWTIPQILKSIWYNQSNNVYKSGIIIVFNSNN